MGVVGLGQRRTETCAFVIFGVEGVNGERWESRRSGVHSMLLGTYLRLDQPQLVRDLRTLLIVIFDLSHFNARGRHELHLVSDTCLTGQNTGLTDFCHNCCEELFAR